VQSILLILQTYTLLCKSDVERAEWKEAIIPLLEQTQGKNRSFNTIIIPLCRAVNKRRLEHGIHSDFRVNIYPAQSDFKLIYIFEREVSQTVNDFPIIFGDRSRTLSAVKVYGASVRATVQFSHRLKCSKCTFLSVLTFF